MKQGDIYETKLKDGRFGAIWILKTGGRFDFSDLDFNLIGVTSFIDSIPPEINDSRLSEILVKKYMYPTDYPVINIYCGDVPKTLRYVGNIKVPRKLRKLKIEIGDGTNGGFPSCGNVPKHIGYEVLIEWRFKNDNENFLAEVEASRLEHDKLMERLRSSKPKKMLSDEVFWNLIAKLDWTNQNDSEIIQPLIVELSQMKIDEIKQFEETLAYKLYQLDTKAHASNIGESSYDSENNYVSDDFFLYARCAAVANGKDFFDKVIDNPSAMPKDIEFEPLLRISESAYELKLKSRFDYVTGVSYETYSNEDGWK